MRLAALTLLSLVVFTDGAAADQSVRVDDSLAHRIQVPKKYTWGKGAPSAVTSAIEQYVYAYDDAWWACIKR